MIDLKLLIKNGVQFGHQSWRVCPKMKPYIWGEKNGIHLIDVSKTATQIDKASQFLHDVAARGEPILWVGTKKAAQPVIEQAAEQLGAPYVTNRWIGGTLTNFSEVKKAIHKLKHYEALLEQSEKMYTKKEYGKFRKITDRIEENVGGIREITWPIGALVVVDAKKEQVAIKEAQRMGIPVVALVDTNADPSGIDYVIPGNDDIARAVRVVLEPLIESVENGRKEAETAKKQQQAKSEKKEQEKASAQEEAPKKQEAADKEKKTTTAKTSEAKTTKASQAKTTTKKAADEEKADDAKQQKQTAQKKTTEKSADDAEKKEQKTQAAKTGTTAKSTTAKKTTSTTAKSSTAAKSAEQKETTASDEKKTTKSGTSSSSATTKQSSSKASSSAGQSKQSTQKQSETTSKKTSSSSKKTQDDSE